jgi:hypothetical protein
MLRPFNLLKTEINILDISHEHGFDYELSYIRAFKREFGMVENLKDIPQEFCKDTFEASLCVKFSYIGQYYYFEIKTRYNLGRKGR